MEKQQYPYFDMLDEDGTGMNIEHWKDIRSVEMHRHDYDELLMIEKGSCRHYYNGAETLLIPGDCVLIKKDYAHGYSVSGAISLFNCQYREEDVDQDVLLHVNTGGIMDQLEKTMMQERKEQRDANENSRINRESYYREGSINLSGYEVSNEKQGVIHTDPEEFGYIASILRRILHFQQEYQRDNTEIIGLEKKKYIEIILLELHRIQLKQEQKSAGYSRENQIAVAEVLDYLEQNITEPLDLDMHAEQHGFCTNYFRKIFRDVTGFSPVKYLNRLRIIRACEYIQKDGYSLKDAAGEVGIYDVNYFSRLFRQIMGFAPSELYDRS